MAKSGQANSAARTPTSTARSLIQTLQDGRGCGSHRATKANIVAPAATLGMSGALATNAATVAPGCEPNQLAASRAEITATAKMRSSIKLRPNDHPHSA